MRVNVCVHVCVPEWSSLTSDDMVLVMESAATRRSFLRFLLGPGEQAGGGGRTQKKKREKRESVVNIFKLKAFVVQSCIFFQWNFRLNDK